MTINLPVLGKLLPDELSNTLRTGFYKFNIKNHIDGLAKEKDGTIFILAVHSKVEGSLWKMVEDMKEHYKKIVFFLVLNPVLKSALIRYEFTAGHEVCPDTKIRHKAMVWKH